MVSLPFKNLEVMLSRRKKVFIQAAVFFLLILLCIITAEVTLRMLGYSPWKPYQFDLKVEGRKKFYVKHPALGYTHLPGEFRMNDPGGRPILVTHGPDTFRMTEPLNSTTRKKPGKEIWIFGCSYTYGQGLNDSETYPWLLQKEFPEFKVVNFGVGGYSTLQSFIQFQEALKTKSKPAYAIVAYGSFHDERNVFSRSRRKLVYAGNELGQLAYPYARLDRNGKLNYFLTYVNYVEFPLMRHSALVHLIERACNRAEHYFYRSREVSEAILVTFYDLARKNDIEFIVAGLDNESARMLRNLSLRGISVVDVSVDLKIDENRQSYNDHHPSARANELYAQKLSAFLKDRFLHRSPVQLS